MDDIATLTEPHYSMLCGDWPRSIHWRDCSVTHVTLLLFFQAMLLLRYAWKPQETAGDSRRPQETTNKLNIKLQIKSIFTLSSTYYIEAAFEVAKTSSLRYSFINYTDYHTELLIYSST